MAAFNEKYRFGSAGFASPADLRQHRRARGPFLGFAGNQPLRIDGDAPLITIGGAGSGKLRDLLAYNICGMRTGLSGWYMPRRILVNDPRGELAAISIHNQIRMRRIAYCVNPFRLHGLPMHSVNPWDTIEPGSPT